MADIINGSTLDVDGVLTDQPRFSISNVPSNDSGSKSVLVSDGTFSINASVKAGVNGSYATRLVDLSEFKSDLLTIFDMNQKIRLVNKSIVADPKGSLQFTIKLISGMSLAKDDILFKLGLPITLGKDISVINKNGYLKVSISNPDSYTVNYNNGSIDLMHYIIRCNEDNGISAVSSDTTYSFGLSFDTVYTASDNKLLAKMDQGAGTSTTVYSTKQIDDMLKFYTKSTAADFTPTVNDGANSLRTDSKVICDSLEVDNTAEVGYLKSNYIDEKSVTGKVQIKAPLDLGTYNIVTNSAIYYNDKIESEYPYTINVSKLTISKDVELGKSGSLKVLSDTTLKNLTSDGTATFNGKSKFTSEFEINPGNNQSISVKPIPDKPSEYKVDVSIPTKFSRLVTIEGAELDIGDNRFYSNGIDIKNPTVNIYPTSSFIFKDDNGNNVASIQYVNGSWVISGSKLLVKNAVWNVT